MAKRPKKTPPLPDGDPAFKEALTCLKALTFASIRLARIQSAIDTRVQAIVRKDGIAIGEYQESIAQLDHRLEILCRNNPEWFVKVRRIKTPFGVLGMQRSTKLELPDELATIRRIRRQGLVSQLIRRTDSVDLEAAERLSEEWLARLGITRKTTERFKATPARTDIHKVVEAMRKSAVNEEEEAAG